MNFNISDRKFSKIHNICDLQGDAFEAGDDVNDYGDDVDGDDDGISCNPCQLRKAKTELQDGFQLSYQPPSLNQLQDGGANPIIIIILIIIITIPITITNIISKTTIHIIIINKNNININIKTTTNTIMIIIIIIIMNILTNTIIMIIIIMQVPFSNMSQQPVEMQKTMQKTKVSINWMMMVLVRKYKYSANLFR